jgi:hypothetical protein
MGMVMMWHAVSGEQLVAIEALDPDAFFEWLDADHDEGTVLDLDKQWHAVHAAMTGSAWEVGGPCGRAVLGGAEFGEDHGYGPARALAPADVAAVADELDALGTDGFAAALAPERLVVLDVYPSGVAWGDPDEIRYLQTSFEELRAFYRRAADAGLAVVALLT